MHNDTPNPDWAQRHATENTREARRWARIARITNDPEGRAFAEGQAAHYYGRAARWEAQAVRAYRDTTQQEAAQ